jgi:hypothetical protein
VNMLLPRMISTGVARGIGSVMVFLSGHKVDDGVVWGS